MPPVTRGQSRRQTLPRTSSSPNQIPTKRRLSDSDVEHRQLSPRKRRKYCRRSGSKPHPDNSNAPEWFPFFRNDRNIRYKENMRPPGMPDWKYMWRREGFGHYISMIE